MCTESVQKQDWLKWREVGNLSEIQYHTALDREVLMVAVWRIDGWKMYCGAVPGQSHADEYRIVAESGTTVSEPLARAVCPWYNDIPYAS